MVIFSAYVRMIKMSWLFHCNLITMNTSLNIYKIPNTGDQNYNVFSFMWRHKQVNIESFVLPGLQVWIKIPRLPRLFIPLYLTYIMLKHEYRNLKITICENLHSQEIPCKQFVRFILASYSRLINSHYGILDLFTILVRRPGLTCKLPLRTWTCETQINIYRYT